MLSANTPCDRNVENSRIDPINNIATIDPTLMVTFGPLLMWISLNIKPYFTYGIYMKLEA
jgi:hypothetical protein